MTQARANGSFAYDHRVTDLSSQQNAAGQLFEEKRYAEALAAYTVLRKLRARTEGRESIMYLSNLHSSVYCLNHLGRWDEALPLIEELSTTRDRTIGPVNESTLDAKRWWVWCCAKTSDYAKASDIQIEIADALYTTGDVEGAERAVATAVFYEGKASSAPTAEVVSKANNAQNSERLKSIAKKVGGGALTAGVSAAFEGVVGGFFGN